MPTLRTIYQTDRIRIAEVSSVWSQTSAGAKILNYEVGDGLDRYCLSFNTRELTWSHGKTVIEK